MNIEQIMNIIKRTLKSEYLKFWFVADQLHREGMSCSS